MLWGQNGNLIGSYVNGGVVAIYMLGNPKLEYKVLKRIGWKMPLIKVKVTEYLPIISYVMSGVLFAPPFLIIFLCAMSSDIQLSLYKSLSLDIGSNYLLV